MEECESCGEEMLDITTNQIASVGCQRLMCPSCGQKKTIQVEDILK